MASIRLCTMSLFLRNLTRVSSNKISPLIIHRENHVMSRKDWIKVMDQNPLILSKVRSVNVFVLPSRLEHISSNPQTVSTVSNKLEIPVTPSSSLEVPNEAATGVNPPTISDILHESALPPIPKASDIILQEPTLKSLGLGGWSPTGIVQNILDFFHTELGLSWWASIVAFTIILRLVILPFTIRMKRDMVNFQNNMPQYQALQEKMVIARRSGNYFETAKTSQEMVTFLKEKKIIGAGMFVPILVQFPLFISTFYGLKEISNTAELTSFQTGGLWWFTDLSVPDQYYLLSLFTSATVWCIIRFGSTVTVSTLKKLDIKKILEIVVPIFVFIFTIRFPAAILCYWSATNFIVLIQTFIFTFELVQKRLKIPKVITHVPNQSQLNSRKKGILDEMKDSYMNLKITHELDERERLNAIKFEKTGALPTKRTFKFDPTKVSPVTNVKEVKGK